ncbi:MULTISPECIES: hypothetical protein [unclassified Bifidobacterium]|uniref:hypothetical protein n=1 Tax=unclassified Bifidobacterium TaxID=2608897 RepID=UPI003F8E81E9
MPQDFTAERPNEKRLTDITEIKAADGKAYLSPVIDCHDGKIVAYTAGYGPNAQLADTMLEKVAVTLPEARVLWRIPTAVVTISGRDGWNSWSGSG